MKKSIKVKDLLKVVKLIQKQNETVQQSLGEFHKLLEMTDSQTEIFIQKPIPRPVGYICRTIELGGTLNKKQER
jgi:hypothetical protein